MVEGFKIQKAKNKIEISINVDKLQYSQYAMDQDLQK